MLLVYPIFCYEGGRSEVILLLTVVSGGLTWAFGKNCKKFMHKVNLFTGNAVLSLSGAALFRILSIKD